MRSEERRLMAKPGLKPTIYRWLPWLLLGAVLLPAVATASVGIVILALWEGAGDIALGVLTICFSVFALAGAGTTISLLIRQNRLAELQTEFIANVSHELRTPLSSIRMYVETLRMGRVRTEQERRSCLEALDRESSRLTALVEKLLEFRHHSLKHHSVRLHGCEGEPVYPKELAAEVLEDLPPARKDRVSLVVEPALPCVLVDTEEAREALTNLISNAVTHGGDDGQVVMTVRSDAEGVAFHVRDTGPGISKREQKKIFKRFYRAKGTSESGVSGFGLGLAIVADFAKKHSGHATVRSTPGLGSTFTVWLPAAAGVQPSGERGFEGSSSKESSPDESCEERGGRQAPADSSRQSGATA